MVKCLNIGKKIGKAIYRSISSQNTPSRDTEELIQATFTLVRFRLKPRLMLCSSEENRLLASLALCFYSCESRETSHE